MEKLRKILFYTLAVIYLIICPVILLYAFGYILRPNVNFEKRIVETGLISISTIPPKATVYLQNRRFSAKTPAIIRDLLSGRYSLRINLKGYKPRSSTVWVSAGKATLAEDIILLPEKWHTRVLLAERFERFIPVPQTQFFILATGPKLKDYFVYDFKRMKSWYLLPPDSALRDFRLNSYYLAKKSNVLVMTISPGLIGDKKVIWVELKEPDNNIRDITRFFSKLPENIIWDYSDPNELFIFNSGHLDKLNLANGFLYPRYIEDVRGWGLYERMLYILTVDNTLIRVYREKRNSKILHKGQKEENPLFGLDGIFRIEPLSNEVILFWDRRGGLYANLLPYKFVEKGVLGDEFDLRTKKLLLWQKDRIGSLELSRNHHEESEEDIFEKAPQISWFFEKGDNILQGFWVYKATHILFLDGSKIYLSRADRRFDPYTDYLFEVKRNSPVYYSDELGKLYYLDTLTGNLCYVEIIPEKEIFELSKKR